MADYSNVKIIELLEYIGEPYSLGGKNVSRDWVGVRCPFPGCSDHSFHCGINLTSKKCSCWKCGTTGLLSKYLYAKLSKNVISELLKRFNDRVLVSSNKLVNVENRLAFHSMNDAISSSRELTRLCESYLEKRNLNPRKTWDKFKLESTGPIGHRIGNIDYRLRILVPFFYKGRFITFSSRDATGDGGISWIHCPVDKSIIHPKEALYNIDTVKETMLITEGVGDVWNIGDGCVSVQGIQFTQNQLLMIQEAKIRNAFFLFDGEKQAQNQAEKMAYSISPYVPHVECLYLDSGDPGEMKSEDVKSLKRQVFGKVW